MTSRILSFVALAGMLVAAGCSGGGAGSGSGLSSGITPAAPSVGGGSTTGSSAATGSGASFAVSFLVPVASSATTASSVRKSQYVSPGSTGLQILLGNSTPCAQTFAVGSAATPLQLQPTPPGGITTPLGSGVCGAGASSGAGVAGTASLASPTFTSVANTNTTISTVPGSATLTPVAGQIIKIQNNAGTTTNFTIQAGGVSGAANTGWILVVQTPTAGAVFSTGALMSFQPGATSTSSYNYTFTPQSNTTAAGGNANAGYYVATVTFTNMTGGLNYTVGVVLTDTANGNYVLSEAQTGNVPVALAGPTSINLTLLPVVAGVYIPTPTPIGALLQTTVFATDERGYVIENQATGNVYTTGVADNAPIITIASANLGGLTFSDYNGYASLGTAASSITAAPAAVAGPAQAQLTVNAAAGAGVANYANTFGTLFVNYLLPTAPLTLALNGGTAASAGGQVNVNTNGVGNPLGITCAQVGTQGLKVSYTTNAGPVVPVTGYTYTTTNYPQGGTIPASGAFSSYPAATALNCNSSIILPIN